jgi:hydrogenase expression/formation protein HypE
MIKKNSELILLAHGSGGRLTHELITTLFQPQFSNPALNAMDDAAVLKAQGKGSLAFTTDSFVVSPLFFPGGDIGKLAVCGTVNDLAMKGAVPLGLSLSAIIEEGFAVSDLKRIVRSAAAAAREAGVAVVTGDTKVVERGKADGIFLTTSGVGTIAAGCDIGGANAVAGDSVLINGPIAEHGIAVLAARNDFKLTMNVKSDCAALNGLVAQILASCSDIHVLRDPTRGGVATTLNEIAAASNVGIILEENSIPVRREVRAACTILGIDPLYVANEGKLLCFLPVSKSGKVLKKMASHRYGKGAAAIGSVVRSPKGVWIRTTAGGLRPLVMLEGEQLPRIC